MSYVIPDETKNSLCKHEWEYKEFKVNFGITWGMQRCCKKCGLIESTNLAIGRQGTPWIRKEKS